MARRTRRSTKRKKKNDTTNLVVIFSGVAFVFVIGFVLLSASSSPKKKKLTKSVHKSQTISDHHNDKAAYEHSARNESNRKSASKASAPSRQKQKGKKTPKRDRPTESTKPVIQDQTPTRPSRNFFSLQNINALPTSLVLPDQPVTRRNLTEGLGFNDTSGLQIKLHCLNSTAIKKPSIHCLDPGDGKWLFQLPGTGEALADLEVTPEGLFFQWHAESSAVHRSFLHNCKLTFSDTRDKKTVQLRPIHKAPEIKLFSRDAENEYSVRIMHAPAEIYWSLEPTDKTLPPFHFPTVGAPTTDGPVPLEESVDWTPENNTGIVKARYQWQCDVKPGIKGHEKRITIHQKKEYKIGDARWRPLTTDSLREDFDSRLEKYDNVVAGIRRKWLKGKAPSLQQVTKLKEMIREGAAFADVRNFYYAVPEREMKLEFRTPCGTTDTLLAQYPLEVSTVEQVQLPRSAPSQKFTVPTEEPPVADEGWTMPPGKNPWAARQQQLEKMTGSKN